MVGNVPDDAARAFLALSELSSVRGCAVAGPAGLRGLRPLIGEACQEQLEPAVLLFGGEPPAALERNETVQGGPEGLGQQP